jgi:hypothetical protein
VRKFAHFSVVADGRGMILLAGYWLGDFEKCGVDQIETANLSLCANATEVFERWLKPTALPSGHGGLSDAGYRSHFSLRAAENVLSDVFNGSHAAKLYADA